MAFSNGYNDMVLQQRFESNSKPDEPEPIACCLLPAESVIWWGEA